jgi:hypothetical protein
MRAIVDNIVGAVLEILRIFTTRGTLFTAGVFGYYRYIHENITPYNEMKQ